jgi:FHA domain
VPEQPEPQTPEPAAAHQEPAAAGQVPPGPIAVPDPVAAFRASCMIASFTVMGSSFSHTLAAGETIALGRDPDWSPLSDHFAADDSVSRKHAELALGADGRAWLTDRESMNHTVVNGKKLPQNAQWEVTRHDQIALGEYTTLKIKIIGGSGHGPAPAGREL